MPLKTSAGRNVNAALAPPMELGYLPADHSILSPTDRTPGDPFLPECAGKVDSESLVLRGSPCASGGTMNSAEYTFE